MLFLAHKWMNKYLNDQNASAPPPPKKKKKTRNKLAKNPSR